MGVKTYFLTVKKVEYSQHRFSEMCQKNVLTYSLYIKQSIRSTYSSICQVSTKHFYLSPARMRLYYIQVRLFYIITAVTSVIRIKNDLHLTFRIRYVLSIFASGNRSWRSYNHFIVCHIDLYCKIAIPSWFFNLTCFYSLSQMLDSRDVFRGREWYMREWCTQWNIPLWL